LFLIGFEINLGQVMKQKRFIIKGTVFTIFLATLFGSILIHFVFGSSWFISVIVALSFSTVGEAVLVPILDEFKIINTRLGQTIVGVGTLDDVVEIIVLIGVVAFIGIRQQINFNVFIIFGSLLILFILTFGLSKLKKENKKFKVSKIETLFLFAIAILFLFLGIGEYAGAGALGAVLAGIGLKTFIPNERVKAIENEIRAVGYGLFAPIFFLWAGISLDVHYLATYPLLILLVVIVTGGAKYLASYLIGVKELGFKQSILLGTGLSIRFSTSIVIVKILLDSKIIADNLYSVIIVSSIIFTLIIPILFSVLLNKWKIKAVIN